MKRTFLFLIAAVLVIWVGNVSAGTYYIGPNGDYPSISAFKSAVASPQNGSDVYFECGNTFVFTSQWSVNWEGGAADRAVVGSFYFSGGKRNIGISGAKPVISGDNNTYPPGEYSYTPSKSVWAALINIDDKDYVTVENLVITQSRGLGIKILGEENNPNVSSQYFIVDNCDITDNYMAALHIHYCENNYGLVKNNYVYNNVLAGNRKLKLFPNHPVTVNVVGSPNANTTFEKNKLVHNWGETLGAFSQDSEPTVHTSHITFRDNFIGGVGTPGIYCDGASNIEIYRNTIIGGNYSGTGDPKFCMSAISINNELYPEGVVTPYNNYQTREINIYNNLIADTQNGVGIGDETLGNVVDKIKIYNNTFIAVYTPLRKVGAGFVTTNCEWKNNIAYCPSGAVCGTENEFTATPGWSLANNAGKGPAYGTNYTIISDSDMADSYGELWQSITLEQLLGSTFKAEDFKIANNSKPINAGVSIPTVLQDYFKTSRPQGNAYDIGAHEYISTSGQAPPPPSNLSVK